MVQAVFKAITALLASSMSYPATVGDKTQVFTPTKYEVVEGIFRQTTPGFNSTDYDLLADSFGLLDKTPSRWSTFRSRIAELNTNAKEGEAYKVIWLARHGQGAHNVAESKYGKEQWDCHYSMLTGDDEMTWGPDPVLTATGEAQARACNKAWHSQLSAGAPLPASWYSSPLTRSANTLNLTWSDIVLDKGVKPVFKEGFRETIGLHTCDKRRPRSYLEQAFKGWTFEVPFADNDELWTAGYQESHLQQSLRTQQTMNAVFASDRAAYISITAHSGTIDSWFTVLGYKGFEVRPGAFVPFVIKAIRDPERQTPVITGAQSATAPSCPKATQK